MDPLTAGIGAAGGLLGGLFGNAAQKKREYTQQALNIEDEEAKRKMQAQGQLGQNQMGAMDKLMSAYNNILVR